MRKLRLTSFIAVMLLGSTACVGAATTDPVPAQISLSGTVVDGQGETLSAMWVRAYEGLREIGSSTTGDDGRFEITLASTNTPVSLRFDSLTPNVMDSLHPEVLNNLSAVADSNITKQMSYVAAQGYEREDLQTLLNHHERVYLWDKYRLNQNELDSRTTRGQIVVRYGNMLGMLKYVDDYTEVQYGQVVGLIESIIPSE